MLDLQHYAVFSLLDVEQGFLPWLVDCVEEELNKKILGRVMLDAIIREVAERRQALYMKNTVPDNQSDDGDALGGANLDIPEPPVSNWLFL